MIYPRSPVLQAVFGVFRRLRGESGVAMGRWEIMGTQTDTPQQPPGYDCAAFLCVLLLSGGRLPLSYGPSGIGRVRKMIARD